MLENLRQSAVIEVPHLHGDPTTLEPSEESVAGLVVDPGRSCEDRLARGTFRYKFLGLSMCRRGWQIITGVSCHRLAL